MKNLGFILLNAVTVFILLVVGIYLLWPQQTSPQPPLVIAIDSDISLLEAELTRREAEVKVELDRADEKEGGHSHSDDD